jgi:hypothetical protein
MLLFFLRAVTGVAAIEALRYGGEKGSIAPAFGKTIHKRGMRRATATFRIGADALV